VAFAPPKPTSINAVAIANDEFEKLIIYRFNTELENQFDAAALCPKNACQPNSVWRTNSTAHEFLRRLVQLFAVVSDTCD